LTQKTFSHMKRSETAIALRTWLIYICIIEA
jgi:hypothetical protein